MKAWNIAGALVSPIGMTRKLEGAISCSEGCLPLMAHCDANIVVASMEVELGVDLCAA